MATSPLELLGKRVRGLRLARGLTQERLAELCEMHHNHISAIERGVTNPTILALLRISRALDSSISELLADFAPSAVKRMRL